MSPTLAALLAPSGFVSLATQHKSASLLPSSCNASNPAAIAAFDGHYSRGTWMKAGGASHADVKEAVKECIRNLNISEHCE